MALAHTIRRYGIELRSSHMVWWPPPQYQWIKSIELFSRKWNALQAWVFFKAQCQFDDGLICEVAITGRHEFLQGGVSTHNGHVYL